MREALRKEDHQVAEPSKNAPRFEDVRFRAHLREHENSTFLGYADATLVVPGVLAEKADLAIRIRGIQVKILNGKPRIDFPQEEAENGRYFPHLFPKSAKSRAALTDALLADRMVHAVVSTILEDQERVRSAAASSDIPF